MPAAPCKAAILGNLCVHSQILNDRSAHSAGSCAGTSCRLRHAAGPDAGARVGDRPTASRGSSRARRKRARGKPARSKLARGKQARGRSAQGAHAPLPLAAMPRDGDGGDGGEVGAGWCGRGGQAAPPAPAFTTGDAPGSAWRTGYRTGGRPVQRPRMERRRTATHTRAAGRRAPRAAPQALPFRQRRGGASTPKDVAPRHSPTQRCFPRSRPTTSSARSRVCDVRRLRWPGDEKGRPRHAAGGGDLCAVPPPPSRPWRLCEA